MPFKVGDRVKTVGVPGWGIPNGFHDKLPLRGVALRMREGDDGCVVLVDGADKEWGIPYSNLELEESYRAQRGNERRALVLSRLGLV
jgi:hypothetical protein